MWCRSVIILVLLGACQDDVGASVDVDGPDAAAESQAGDGVGTETTAGPSELDDDVDASRRLGDATTVDGGLMEDAAGASAGTACQTEDECRSGWCVPSAIGQVCVDACTDVCAAGLQCIPAAESGTDPVYLCVPFVAPPSPDAGVGSDVELDAGPPADAVPTDVGPEPDAPGPETVVADNDSDGDGIPDDQDNLPCLAIHLVVYNQGVTAASLTLNGVEVVASNAFPTSEPITVFINPTSGSNELALGGQLTGSPSDTLTFVVVDTTGHIYFATVIERNPGKPVDHTYTFEIDATCP